MESTQKRREQGRARVERYRNKQKSVTSDSVTQEDNVTQETVPVSYVEWTNGRMYQSLPERPRFLTLSDGQVLDRLNQPTPNKSGDQAMQACNEGAYNFKPNQSSKERIKELMKGI